MRVKLEDVCKRIYAGGDVPKDRYSVDKTDIFNVPIFANAEKDDGLYGYTDEARENELSITVAARGTIGYTAIRREPFLPVVRLITVVPNLSKVSARYLYYVLRNYKPKSSGTSIPQLTVPDIKNNFINIISISEQEKIADRLDKVSKLIELRQKEIAMFDTLIKARFVEMFGDPESNSKNWPVYKLSDLCNVGSSKRIYQEEQTADGIPFWRISDLVNKMDTGSADSGLYISQDKYNELIKNDQVPVAGDILVTSRGTLGRCYIISDTDKFYFQDGMISWLSKYKTGITPLYIKYLFMTSGLIRQINGMQAGSTVAYLSIGMLKKLNIMLPDLEAQNNFADFVYQVDKSKVAVQKALDETQTLFDSLMQEYFG